MDVLDPLDALGVSAIVFISTKCHAARSSSIRANGLPSGRVSDGGFPFAIRQRVRFAETDMQGVVYYANYLVYAEVGRAAYLRHVGMRYDHLLASGLDFTIGEASVRYRAPLRYDEEFDVRVRVGELRRVSWSFEYAVDRADGERCADMTTIQVVFDRSRGRSARIPDDVRAALAGGQA